MALLCTTAPTRCWREQVSADRLLGGGLHELAVRPLVDVDGDRDLVADVAGREDLDGVGQRTLERIVEGILDRLDQRRVGQPVRVVAAHDDEPDGARYRRGDRGAYDARVG